MNPTRDHLIELDCLLCPNERGDVSDEVIGDAAAA